MKKFVSPEIEVQKFCVEDIITTSGDLFDQETDRD